MNFIPAKRSRTLSGWKIAIQRFSACCSILKPNPRKLLRDTQFLVRGARWRRSIQWHWWCGGVANVRPDSHRRPAIPPDPFPAWPRPWDTSPGSCAQRPPELSPQPSGSRPSRFLQCRLRLALLGFGQFVEDIGGLVHPAALLAGFGIRFIQCGPEAHGTVTNRQ